YRVVVPLDCRSHGPPEMRRHHPVGPDRDSVRQKLGADPLAHGKAPERLVARLRPGDGGAVAKRLLGTWPGGAAKMVPCAGPGTGAIRMGIWNLSGSYDRDNEQLTRG